MLLTEIKERFHGKKVCATFGYGRTWTVVGTVYIVFQENSGIFYLIPLKQNNGFDLGPKRYAGAVQDMVEIL